MFCWTEETIRFRRDAAEAVGYDACIAAQLKPWLPEHARLCDAGCGLGYLSLALAGSCAQVTAVDIAPAPLAVLRQQAERAYTANLTVIEGDVFALRPAEPYDAMIFCFFGRVRETLAAVRAQCSGTAVLVKKNWERHRFSLDGAPLKRFTYARTLDELDMLGVAYRTFTFPLDMGQPFRSLEDAALFFRLYGAPEAELTPERVRAQLVESALPGFPYYLPAENSLGVILVDAGDIPDSIVDG